MDSIATFVDRVIDALEANRPARVGGCGCAGAAAEPFHGAADIGRGHDPGQMAAGEHQRPVPGAHVEAGQHVGDRLVPGWRGAPTGPPHPDYEQALVYAVLSLEETLRGAVAELGGVAEQIRLASRRR
jgi:hypothetical protein